jgi:hypothetical protein
LVLPFPFPTTKIERCFGLFIVLVLYALCCVYLLFVFVELPNGERCFPKILNIPIVGKLGIWGNGTIRTLGTNGTFQIAKYPNCHFGYLAIWWQFGNLKPAWNANRIKKNEI